jgi:hypothetical protein
MNLGNEVKVKFSMSLSLAEVELIVEALSLYKDAEHKAVLGAFDANGRMYSQDRMKELGTGELGRLVSEGELYLKHVPIGPPHTKLDEFRLDKMWDGFIKIMGKIERKTEEKWESKAEESINDVVDSSYKLLRSEND